MQCRGSCGAGTMKDGAGAAIGTGIGAKVAVEAWDGGVNGGVWIWMTENCGLCALGFRGVDAAGLGSRRGVAAGVESLFATGIHCSGRKRSSYPSQTRPVCVHRLQLGLASSHLTRRVLLSTSLTRELPDEHPDERF
jgi:hypothetical protein